MQDMDIDQSNFSIIRLSNVNKTPCKEMDSLDFSRNLKIISIHTLSPTLLSFLTCTFGCYFTFDVFF